MNRSFTPGDRKTQTVSASNSASASATVDAAPGTVRIVNNSGSVAFIRFGTGTTTATTADTPMLNGTVELFDKGGQTTVAVILAAGSGSVYVTTGEGT